MLVTTALTENAFASHHRHGSSTSQSIAQSNGGNCGQCSNQASQISGSGNAVTISSNQNN
ncbi:MAG: hypothetical protein WA421_15905 [Nitrososphaeraceae archaeon]